ncbi:MAG TPA: hypothetical protein DHN33_03600 [Eubacteriaceae bacterium]|nr:hypothetical protein [Eubacteriaceae bacterium]
MKKHKSGYTVIELLVTILLIGIFSSIALLRAEPLFAFQENRSFELQVKEIVSTLEEERHLSMLDGNRRQIYFFRDKIYLQTIDLAKGVSTRKITYQNGLTITGNTYQGGTLLFYPWGTVNKGGHVTFVSPNGLQQTLVVQIGSGRMYLREGE